MLRSAWMAQELLTTFQDELDSVSLIPSRAKPGGVFCVRRDDNEILWDRKAQGGFPESKELKQRIRDLIAPDKGLGHSDTTTTEERNGTNAEDESARTKREDCEECNQEAEILSTSLRKSSTAFSAAPPSPNVAITYCTGCRWLLRAAWIMQELFTTFDAELNSITLIPSRPPAKGGIFVSTVWYIGANYSLPRPSHAMISPLIVKTVTLDGELLWDRSEEGAFPQPKELKQMIRDRINPMRDLGHSDGKPAKTGLETMEDDDAEEMRKYFGVM
jgi:selenoprotein W-related protein